MFSTDEDQVDWGFDRHANELFEDLMENTAEREFNKDHHLVEKAQKEIERELAEEKAKQMAEMQNKPKVEEEKKEQKPAVVQVRQARGHVEDDDDLSWNNQVNSFAADAAGPEAYESTPEVHAQQKKKDLGKDQLQWDVYHNTKDHVETLPWIRPSNPDSPANRRNVAPSPSSPQAWPSTMAQQKDLGDKQIDKPIFDETTDNVEVFAWKRMDSPHDSRNTAPMSAAQKAGISNNDQIRMDVFHNAQPHMDIASWSRPKEAPPAEVSYPVKKPDNWKPMSGDTFFRTLTSENEDDSAFVFYDNENKLWRY